MPHHLEDTLPEAVAEALGQVIGELQRKWEQELEMLRAERRALVAELRLAALGQASSPVPTGGAETAKPTAKQARAR